MNRRGLLGGAMAGAAAILLPVSASANPLQASGSDLDDLSRLACDYLSDRAQRVTAIRPSTNRLTSLRLSKDHLRSYRQEAEHLDQVRRSLNGMHDGYLRSKTTVTVDDLTIDGAAAIAQVTELTELYFVDTSAGVASTAYCANHEVEAHRSASGWILDRSTYRPTNDISSPVTQFSEGALKLVEASANAGRSLVRVADVKNTSGGDGVSIMYNYQAMVDYARAWAFGMNSAYPTNYASDCTNFVSQVLHAGGWAIVDGSRTSNWSWYYGSWAQTTSYTWGAVQNLHYFCGNTGRTYVLGSGWDMGMGDMLFYDQDKGGEMDHSQTCTGRNSTQPLMTQHSSSYRDKPLSEISAFVTSNTWAHRT